MQKGAPIFPMWHSALLLTELMSGANSIYGAIVSHAIPWRATPTSFESATLRRVSNRQERTTKNTRSNAVNEQHDEDQKVS